MFKRRSNYYIISNIEEGKIKSPLILYEDGSFEVKQILNRQKYYINYGKQYYEGLKYNLNKLRFRNNDLRKEFYCKRDHIYLHEVLDEIRDQKTITIKRLWEFFYKDEVENIIDVTINLFYKRFSMIVEKCFKNRPKYDTLLRNIGRIK